MSKETFKNDDYIYKDNGVFTRTVASTHPQVTFGKRGMCFEGLHF